LTCKTVACITYTVLVETLNHAQSINCTIKRLAGKILSEMTSAFVHHSGIYAKVDRVQSVMLSWFVGKCTVNTGMNTDRSHTCCGGHFQISTVYMLEWNLTTSTDWKITDDILWWWLHLAPENCRNYNGLHQCNTA